ncbi:MAG: sugar phosphate isomerase/epimerase [Verrucomicrobia bacterium]|nr:sugar phosphate isomerase/epimerase [Verrucomicrobiota bacterium]
MHRRAFLASAAAFAAASPFAAKLFPAEAPRTQRIRKGYMLSAFPAGGKDLPIAEKFKMIRAAGFAAVEPHGLLDQDEVLRARDAARLVIPSVVIGSQTRKLNSPIPSVRAQAIEALKQALRDAKRYGARAVLAIAGGVDEQTGYAENWDRTQAAIREALPLAGELGVKIAIENVWNNFLLSPIELAKYVDDFHSPWVAVHFDIGNMMYVGWPEHWIRVLGKRIVTVHVKEYSRKKHETEGKKAGFAVDYLEGDNNWPAILRALDETGYEGFAICEPGYRPPGLEPAARLKQVSEKLDKILAS